MHYNFYLKHFLIRSIIKNFFDSRSYSLKEIKKWYLFKISINFLQNQYHISHKTVHIFVLSYGNVDHSLRSFGIDINWRRALRVVA